MTDRPSHRYKFLRGAFLTMLALLCAALCTWFSDRYLDLGMAARWNGIKGYSEPPTEVVVAYYDDDFQRTVGRSKSWPQLAPAGVAELLEKIGQAQPKAVILDSAFDENHDSASEERVLNAMRLAPTYMAYSEVREDWRSELREEYRSKGREWNQNINPSRYFTDHGIPTFYSDIPWDRAVKTFPTHNYGAGEVPTVAKLLQAQDVRALPSGSAFINYYAPEYAVYTIQCSDIMSRSLDDVKRGLQGKYVFIGWDNPLSSGRGEPVDRFWTPYGSSLPEAKFHATMLGNILDGSWKMPLTFFQKYLTVLVASGIFAYFLLTATPALRFCIFVMGLLVSMVSPYMLFCMDLVGSGPLPLFCMCCLICWLDRLGHLSDGQAARSSERESPTPIISPGINTNFTPGGLADAKPQ